ncbi:MAG: DinB family protein [Anaerolineales bacterium]|nr:DinB family protein [Anaerolineales bacterium]
MTLTLLVDLDNTLLGNDMETFIPAYLGALGAHLADLIPPEKMVSTMLTATQEMVRNNTFDRTLKEAFDPNFYPPLGLVEEEVRAIIDRFYAEFFPKLQPKTEFRPQGVDLVEAALARGYQVGIATNPLFPLTAITQRLDWAGLAPDEVPFTLVPSYETFHFAKPNPAYFAEFLGRTGWPEGPALMVGNDPDHDVRGAQEMGIPVFWIENGDESLLEGQPAPDGSGSLADLLPWIDSRPARGLEPDFSSPSAMIATLRGSPAALSTLLSDLPEAIWTRRPGSKSWSLTEIACHLRDVEREVNLPRLHKITREDNPFISGVDSDTWADERQYNRQDGPAAFTDFLAARRNSLTILEQLTPQQWGRYCRHAIFGPTTLTEIVHFTAIHERLHGRQIHQSLAAVQTP